MSPPNRDAQSPHSTKPNHRSHTDTERQEQQGAGGGGGLVRCIQREQLPSPCTLEVQSKAEFWTPELPNIPFRVLTNDESLCNAKLSSISDPEYLRLSQLPSPASSLTQPLSFHPSLPCCLELRVITHPWVAQDRSGSPLWSWHDY